MTVVTGHGCVLTANPGGWAGLTQSFAMHEASVPILDISSMSTTGGRAKMAGDLIDAGAITTTCFLEDEDVEPVPGDAGTLTVTNALGAATTAANFSGQAILSRVAWGSRETDVVQTLEIEYTWNGAPTYTVAT